ncbi:MAG: hypothetical protein RL261_2643, partial [Pseudomonadota bacterium]
MFDTSMNLFADAVHFQFQAR